MSTAFPSPVVLDDAQLLKAAATPRGRLFPLLNCDFAFTPLILVCCIVPVLQLLIQPTLNEEASLWGLRSLAAANAATTIEFIEPGLNEFGQPLLFQPPLAPWLNGFVLRTLGTSHPLSSSLVSLVAITISIGVISRMAWKLGGANTALLAAVLMCSHPQVLEWAMTPSDNALGLCLILISIGQFQRHLESGSTRITLDLVIGGIAWGLSLLAVGAIALTIPLLFVCFGFAIRRESSASQSPSNPIYQPLLVLVGLGLIVGGWWEMLMWSEFGARFVELWWTSLPVVCQSHGTTEWHCDILPLLQQTWRGWLGQQSLLIGWFIVGLGRSLDEWLRPTVAASTDPGVKGTNFASASDGNAFRHRHQILLLWWLMAFCGRFLAEVLAMKFQANTSIWNLVLLPPTVLLATQGICTLIERAVSRQSEFFLVVMAAGTMVAQWTASWKAGAIGALVVTLFLIFGPKLKRVLGRVGEGWPEKRWRQVLQLTVYTSLFACLASGIVQRCSASVDENCLADLRDRLATMPEVRRVSLLITRDPVPVTLTYLLRCRWPNAEIVTSDGWDIGLTQAMKAESKQPRSRFLILEWTRRDVRLTADTDQQWRISSIGEPMRFLGRRLSLIMIGPKS